jgi:hypothetical protein
MIIKKYEQFFNDIEIDIINPDDKEDVLDVLFECFGKFVNNKYELFKKLEKRIFNELSICLKVDNKVVGVYLLNPKSINEFITDIKNGLISDFPKDKTKILLNDTLSDRGIQGIALCVSEPYRNLGYGEKLKEYVDNLGYDYIWGVQDKELKNIDFWKKTRKVFAESDTRWATYKINSTI